MPVCVDATNFRRGVSVHFFGVASEFFHNAASLCIFRLNVRVSFGAKRRCFLFRRGVTLSFRGLTLMCVFRLDASVC